jgi:hypothetical protein
MVKKRGKKGRKKIKLEHYEIVEIGDIDKKQLVPIGMVYSYKGIYLIEPREGIKIPTYRESGLERKLNELSQKIENYQSKEEEMWRRVFGNEIFGESKSNDKTDPPESNDKTEQKEPLIYQIVDKRIEEKTQKLREEFEARFKQIEERLDKIEKLVGDLPSKIIEIIKAQSSSTGKEVPSQATQTVGEKVYTLTPPAVQTPEKVIEPTTQVQSATQPPTPIIEEIKNYGKEKDRKIKTRASTILEAYKLKDEEIQNLIDNYRKVGKSEEEILPLEIALAIKTRRIYYTICKGNLEYRGDTRLLNAVKEIFDLNVEGANDIYRLMYWPEEEVKRYIKRKKEEMDEAYERVLAQRAGIF